MIKQVKKKTVAMELGSQVKQKKDIKPVAVSSGVKRFASLKEKEQNVAKGNNKVVKVVKKVKITSVTNTPSQSRVQGVVISAGSNKENSVAVGATENVDKKNKKKQNKKTGGAQTTDTPVARPVEEANKDEEEEEEEEDIDDIFADAASKIAAKIAAAKKEKPKAKPCIPPPDDSDFFDSRGLNTQRRAKVDGLFVYNHDELQLGKGGDTDLCPFDCQCCH